MANLFKNNLGVFIHKGAPGAGPILQTGLERHIYASHRVKFHRPVSGLIFFEMLQINADHQSLAPRSFAASTRPANEAPKSIFIGKMPLQTEKTSPQAWGWIPHLWGSIPRTWGVDAQAWGQAVRNDPPIPHVSNLRPVSRKHTPDLFGNADETEGSLPQAWGLVPHMWG